MTKNRVFVKGIKEREFQKTYGNFYSHLDFKKILNGKLPSTMKSPLFSESYFSGKNVFSFDFVTDEPPIDIIIDLLLRGIKIKLLFNSSKTAGKVTSSGDLIYCNPSEIKTYPKDKDFYIFMEEYYLEEANSIEEMGEDEISESIREFASQIKIELNRRLYGKKESRSFAKAV